MSRIKPLFRFISCPDTNRASVLASCFVFAIHLFCGKLTYRLDTHVGVRQHMWGGYCMLLDAKCCALICHNSPSFAFMISYCDADEVQGERSIASVRARCVQYLDRAEQLKEYLDKKESDPPRKPVKESQSDDKGWDTAYCPAGLYLHVFIVLLGLLYCCFLCVSTDFVSSEKKSVALEPSNW